MCMAVSWFGRGLVFVVLQLWGCVQLFAAPCSAVHQASLSFIIPHGLLKVMSLELMMSYNYLILCHPLSFCPQSFPASGSFPMSWLFSSGGQNIGASVTASVLPMNIWGWFSLGLTGLISLLSKGLSSTTVRKHLLISHSKKKKNEDLAPFLSLVPPNICTFPSSHAPKLFKGCPYSSSFTSDIPSIHLPEGSSVASELLVQAALPGSAQLSSGDLSAASIGIPLASLLGRVSCFWYYILSVLGFILKFGWRHCQQSPEKWGMGYKFFETLPSFIIFPQHFEGIILLPSSCWNYFEKSEISNS